MQGLFLMFTFVLGASTPIFETFQKLKMYGYKWVGSNLSASFVTPGYSVHEFPVVVEGSTRHTATQGQGVLRSVHLRYAASFVDDVPYGGDFNARCIIYAVKNHPALTVASSIFEVLDGPPFSPLTLRRLDYSSRQQVVVISDTFSPVRSRSHPAIAAIEGELLAPPAPAVLAMEFTEFHTAYWFQFTVDQSVLFPIEVDDPKRWRFFYCVSTHLAFLWQFSFIDRVRFSDRTFIRSIPTDYAGVQDVDLFPGPPDRRRARSPEPFEFGFKRHRQRSPHRRRERSLSPPRRRGRARVDLLPDDFSGDAPEPLHKKKF